MRRRRRAGVDAAFVDLTGWRGSESVTLDRRIAEALAPLDLSRQLPIVTGYAQCEEGLVRLYGRGYSEITFSRIPVHLGAADAVLHNNRKSVGSGKRLSFRVDIRGRRNNKK